jgi:hypothetical protein
LELDAAFEAIKDKPDPKTGDADKNTMHEILGMNNGDED